MMPMAGTNGSHELTGRMVLFTIVAFFAVVFAVNLVMVGFALTTFGGVETQNAYQAGVSFKNEIAAAHAQDTRHWTVELKLSTNGNEATVEISPRDKSGKPLAGYELSALLAHPADRRQDRRISLAEAAPGRYRGISEVAPGQWDMVIDITQRGDRLFRSRNRVELR